MVNGTSLAKLRRRPALERASEAARMMDDHRAAMAALARVRREALAELVASGQTQTEIARQLGVSQAAIAKALRAV